MNGDRVDALARTFAHPASRRATLTRVAVSLLAFARWDGARAAAVPPRRRSRPNAQVSATCSPATSCRSDGTLVFCGAAGGCALVQQGTGGCACIALLCGGPCMTDADCGSGVCVSAPGCCGGTSGFCGLPCGTTSEHGLDHE